MVPSCQGMEPRGWSPGLSALLALGASSQHSHPPSHSPITHGKHKAVLGPICTYGLPVPGARRLKEPSRNQCAYRNKCTCLPTWWLGLCDTTRACLLGRPVSVSVGCAPGQLALQLSQHAATCDSFSTPPWAQGGSSSYHLLTQPLGTVTFPDAAPEHLACRAAGRGNKLISIVMSLLLCWLMGDCSILPSSFVSRESYTC